MNDIAGNGALFRASINGQQWQVAWYPPPDPPAGTPHGAEAVCVVGDRIVVVSPDGQRWGMPAGRPERQEQWVDTMRREVREEACAEVMDCRLLGFSRGVCVQGPQEGLVLIRSMWRAEVCLAPWDPRFEMAHRRLVPADEVLQHLTIPDGLGPFYRRLFAEAAHGPSGDRLRQLLPAPDHQAVPPRGGSPGQRSPESDDGPAIDLP